MARKHAIRFDARFSDEQAIRAFEEHGSITFAAQALGVETTALYRRFKLIDYSFVAAARPRPRPKKQQLDHDRRRRADHQQKVRDANRKRGRCLNETKHKRHAAPSVNPRTDQPYSKCDDCRKVI